MIEKITYRVSEFSDWYKEKYSVEEMLEDNLTSFYQNFSKLNCRFDSILIQKLVVDCARDLYKKIYGDWEKNETLTFEIFIDGKKLGKFKVMVESIIPFFDVQKIEENEGEEHDSSGR